MLQEYSCGDKSTDILKEYLKDKRSATLPRNVIIKDEINGVNCLLRDSTLKPVGFNCTSEGDSFFVLQDGGQNDETLSCDEDQATEFGSSGQSPASARNNPSSGSSSRPPDDPGPDNLGIY